MPDSMTQRFCARAPVRVDPAGGGTDAPPFCLDHGGCVLNFAVDRHMYATVQRLAPGEGIYIFAADQGKGVYAPNVSALDGDGPLEFLRGFVRRLVGEDASLLLITEADVPSGSGLGGSGALGVAVAAALDAAMGRTRTQAEVAAIANDVERGDLGYAGGCQDSYGAAMGGINLIHCHTDGTAAAEPVEITDEARLELEHRSLLIYTGASHVSFTIHEDIRSAYAQPDSPVLAAMFALKQAAFDTAEALRSGHLTRYAELLSECTEHLYALHPSCDSPLLQQFHARIANSVAGVKTCGAGGGGYLLAYTRPGRRYECKQQATSLDGVVEPVSIDWAGLRRWAAPPLDDATVAAICDRIRRQVQTN